MWKCYALISGYECRSLNDNPQVHKVRCCFGKKTISTIECNVQIEIENFTYNYLLWIVYESYFTCFLVSPVPYVCVCVCAIDLNTCMHFGTHNIHLLCQNCFATFHKLFFYHKLILHFRMRSDIVFIYNFRLVHTFSYI